MATESPAVASIDPAEDAGAPLRTQSGFAPIAGLDAIGLGHCILQREDGIYADPGSMGQSFLAAYEHVMRANQFFTDIDYPLLLKALYGYGPALPERTAHSMLRFASGVAHFDMARRSLYKNIQFSQGAASYSFEAPPEGTTLSVDEFVSHLWEKGVRFGLDLDAIRAGIEEARAQVLVVARAVPATPGTDARIDEVSQYLHRNDAPLELANGKLDLMAFQNRFPQIKAKSRLLQKIPAVPGHPGIDITGAPLLPAAPQDVDLWLMMADGTAVQVDEDGEFLVATRTGYLDINPATHKIAIGDKIVSRDGVSSRTTGNLTLKGDYEEYGEVQEKRVIEGEGITIHGAVFGHVVSRGGDIVLHSNLIGGSATNARGPVRVAGMASNAVIQSRQGEVVLQHADNCVVSGNRVTIEHAVNCEIIADEVQVGHAEGCAIGARRVSVGRAAPRKQSDMVVFALRPDSAEMDKVIGLMQMRVQEFADAAARHRASMDAMTADPPVARYVQLAGRIRKQELVLTAEQQHQFQKMAQAVAPALKAIAKVSADIKAAETERAAGQALVDQLVEQRRATATAAHVDIAQVEGETTVRTLEYDPNRGMPHDLQARDIKQRLRSKVPGGDIIFVGSSGAVQWDS